MKIDLSGRKILVTGASRGIGYAIAKRLIEAGAKVAVHFHKAEKEAAEIVAASHGRAEMFQANLAIMGECALLWNRVLASFGSIDTLVNNAGIAIPVASNVSTFDWDRLWDTTLAVNLKATGMLSDLAVKHFLSQDGGRIVNIASRAAFRGDTPEYFAYAASKGGVVALTRSIARAYGKSRIKAFTVAPGFVKTDMANDFIAAYGESFVTNDLALDTLTKPDDIAPTVVFLVSGLADHATGGTFDINAGSYVH